MTRSLSLMLSALKSWKLSTQSPAWRRKARPAATSPRALVSCRASPAKTSGGRAESCLTASSSAASSGQSGCCSAGRSCHAEGDQVATSTPPAWTVAGPVRNVVRVLRDAPLPVRRPVFAHADPRGLAHAGAYVRGPLLLEPLHP